MSHDENFEKIAIGNVHHCYACGGEPTLLWYLWVTSSSCECVYTCDTHKPEHLYKMKIYGYRYLDNRQVKGEEIEETRTN